MRKTLYFLMVKPLFILLLFSQSSFSQITIGIKNASSCTNADGEATITVLTPAVGFDFEYAVDGGKYQSDGNFKLAAGKHRVSVRDRNTQCSFFKDFTISADIAPGKKANVAFVIDDTGSMGNDIEGVKQAVLRIFNSPEYANNSCNVYQLITFKDNVTVRNPTTDLQVIKNQISALYASGGGDCPEASAEAINTAKGILEDKGTIFVATDAATHSGINITAIGNQIRAAGINFSIILSGNCDSPETSAATFLGSGNILPNNYGYSSYADNHDTANSSYSPSITAVADLPSNATAIQTFSYLANIAGGAFAYVSEVKSGKAEDLLRYQNIAYNMMIGSIVPAIIALEPRKAPYGSVVALTINSAKTNFSNKTTLSFNDSGIIIKSFKVVSPTKLEALIKVDSSASLGFKNIKAHGVNVSGIDTAEGLGLLQVTTPPSVPTVVSISPISGKTGEKLTVTITGTKTNFSNLSKVNLGNGISISNVKAISKEELQADIKIDTSAILGYHNVSVTTGSETATESVVGPFLVITADCDLSKLDLGNDKTVYVDIPDSTCTTLSVSGINNNEISTYKFVWSTGDTTQTIKVCPSANTLYKVQVTKGSCTFIDSLNVFAKYKTTLTCPGNKTVEGGDNNCAAIVKDIDPVLLPANSTAKVNYSLSGATNGKGGGSASGKTFNKGITKVSYSLSHDSTKACSFNVEVKECSNKPLLSIEDISVSENQLLALVSVRLSNPGKNLVFVKYTTEDGTAIHPKDYIKIEGWLLFVPGINTVAKVIVPIIPDKIIEGDEYFKMKLSEASNAGIKNELGIVTIKDVNPKLNNIITDSSARDGAITNNKVGEKVTEYFQQVETEKQEAIKANNTPLSINVYPNPSPNGFTVKTSSNDNKNKVTLMVYDVNGNILEVKNKISIGQAVQVGENYRAGSYFIIALQGWKKVQTKVIKLRN